MVNFIVNDKYEFNLKKMEYIFEKLKFIIFLFNDRKLLDYTFLLKFKVSALNDFNI